MAKETIKQLTDAHTDRQLKADRLIKIYIGEGIEQKQFPIQESLLTASSDYFRRALNEAGQMKTQSGSLFFPGDGKVIAAWGMMLHWIMHKALPVEHIDDDDEDDLTLFVEAWILGHRFLLPLFQNRVMMHLIDHFERCVLPFDAALVNKLLSISPVDTPLRRLLAEEAVHIMFHKSPNNNFPGQRMDPSEVTGEDGAVGLIGSLLQAQSAFMTRNGRFDRQKDGYGNPSQAWQEYLLVVNMGKDKDADGQLAGQVKSSSG